MIIVVLPLEALSIASRIKSFILDIKACMLLRRISVLRDLLKSPGNANPLTFASRKLTPLSPMKVQPTL